MSRPYTYEESLRVHRQAFMDWLGGLHVDYAAEEGESWPERKNWPILRVFASPDRTFAAVADLLVHSGWFKDKAGAEAMRTAAKDITILPLPVATIQMADPVQDSTFASAMKWVARTFNEATGRYERHPWPGHYRTEFTVNFWCRKGYTADHIREWVQSNFGKPGANNDETFIPVRHAEPWGTMFQALKLTGGTDNSALEGSDPRYQRFSYTFSLRTWVMRVTTVEAESVESIVLSEAGEPLPPDAVDDAAEYATADPRRDSGNLFAVPFPDSRIPTLWPRTGDARVSRPKYGVVGPARLDALAIEVEAVDDTVDLGEWLTAAVDGDAVFSVWFDYCSNGPVALELYERSGPSQPRSVVATSLLPRALQWSPAHRFALFGARFGAAAIVGAGAPARVYLSRVHVVRLAPADRVWPTALTATGAVFDGLPSEPYVVCVRAVGPDGDIVTVRNDAASPTDVQTFPVGHVAALTQPSQASVRVEWPATTTVASAWVQRYYSPYHGNTA